MAALIRAGMAQQSAGNREEEAVFRQPLSQFQLNYFYILSVYFTLKKVFLTVSTWDSNVSERYCFITSFPSGFCSV